MSNFTENLKSMLNFKNITIFLVLAFSLILAFDEKLENAQKKLALEKQTYENFKKTQDSNVNYSLVDAQDKYPADIKQDPVSGAKNSQQRTNHPKKEADIFKNKEQKAKENQKKRQQLVETLKNSSVQKKFFQSGSEFISFQDVYSNPSDSTNSNDSTNAKAAKTNPDENLGQFMGRNIYRKKDSTKNSSWGKDKFYALNSRTQQLSLVEGDLQILFKKNAATDLAEFAKEYNLELKSSFPNLAKARFKVQAGEDLLTKIDSIRSDPQVQSAELLLYQDNLRPF